MSLQLVALKRDGTCRWPVDVLRKTLKDPVWAVRFGALQQLDAYEMGGLLRMLFPGVTVIQALTMEGGEHSATLQSYAVALGYDTLVFDAVVGNHGPDPEPERDDLVLAELAKEFEVVVAKDLDQLNFTLANTMMHMPGKQGRMEIKAQRKVDRRNRKKVGFMQARITHPRHAENAVFVDDSGSVGEKTLTAVAHAVKAMAVKANAHLVLVSNTVRHFKPGEYTVASILANAEYMGTHYETLVPLMNRHWGKVITIADFDSSWGAKEALSTCTGSIDTLLDISYVDRPTFLAECLDHLARESRPLMVGASSLNYKY